MAIRERALLRDGLHDAVALIDTDAVGIVGYGIVELRDGDNQLISITPFANKITDSGDLYYAQKAIVGISPASPSAPTAANGMKLGTTSSTPAGKNGTGAALQAYLPGTNVAFDTSGGPFPQTSNQGAGAGVTAVYKTTWGAGTPSGTNTIVEAIMCNDQATNLTSSAANTYARTTFANQVKAPSDSLAITWNHLFLGA